MLYRLVFRLPPRESLQLFDRDSETFNALRRGLFPPPYANGWYKVCELDDLKNGRIQSVSAFGHDLVVFQAANGEIGVLDAFCPHLGTCPALRVCGPDLCEEDVLFESNRAGYVESHRLVCVLSVLSITKCK